MVRQAMHLITCNTYSFIVYRHVVVNGFRRYILQYDMSFKTSKVCKIKSNKIILLKTYNTSNHCNNHCSTCLVIYGISDLRANDVKEDEGI